MDLPDVARHLGEDRRLLGRENVRREGEFDLDVPSLGGDDSDDGVRPAASDGAGRPSAGPVPDGATETSEEYEQDDPDAIASQEIHLLSKSGTDRVIGPGAAPILWMRGKESSV